MTRKQLNQHQAIELSNALQDAVAGSRENNRAYAVVYSEKLDAAVAMPEEEGLGEGMGFDCVMVVGG